MPEGDTIHRAAKRLRPALEGRAVVSFAAPRLGGELPAPGTVIDGVEARGKYLLVHFDDGTTLETHMKMSGSWHLYRVGERWRRGPGSARVVIETDGGWQAVCFAAPHVRLLRPNRPGRAGDRPATGHLGPDLCGEDPDLDEGARRFDLLDPSAPAVDALLDQRVCCGVGNVYKSEVLHLHGIHPLTPVAAIDEATRLALVTTAHRLLRRNLAGGARVTTTGPAGGPDLAVYGRRGQPCLPCGEPVAYAKLGHHPRGTYWCPGCQPEPPGSPGEATPAM